MWVAWVQGLRSRLSLSDVGARGAAEYVYVSSVGRSNLNEGGLGGCTNGRRAGGSLDTRALWGVSSADEIKPSMASAGASKTSRQTCTRLTGFARPELSSQNGSSSEICADLRSCVRIFFSMLFRNRIEVATWLKMR